MRSDEMMRMESILGLPDSMIEPIDRGGTSSSNYTAADRTARRSLLIDNPESQPQIGVKRRASARQKNLFYHYYRQWCKKMIKFIQKRMAFKPSVPDDPRIFSPAKKRVILACLASGSSLNGFCSTVYVNMTKLAIVAQILNNFIIVSGDS